MLLSIVRAIIINIENIEIVDSPYFVVFVLFNFYFNSRPYACCGWYGVPSTLVHWQGLVVWGTVEGLHGCAEELGGDLHHSWHQTCVLL